MSGRVPWAHLPVQGTSRVATLSFSDQAHRRHPGEWVTPEPPGSGQGTRTVLLPACPGPLPLSLPTCPATPSPGASSTGDRDGDAGSRPGRPELARRRCLPVPLSLCPVWQGPLSHCQPSPVGASPGNSVPQGHWVLARDTSSGHDGGAPGMVQVEAGRSQRKTWTLCAEPRVSPGAWWGQGSHLELQAETVWPCWVTSALSLARKPQCPWALGSLGGGTAEGPCPVSFGTRGFGLELTLGAAENLGHGLPWVSDAC